MSGRQRNPNSKPGGSSGNRRFQKRRRRPSGRNRGAPEKITGDLFEVTGILETLPDGFGFLREMGNNYQSTPSDVFVPAQIIREAKIQTGSELIGMAGMARGKPRMVELKTVDGLDAAAASERAPFQRLTSIDPIEKLKIAEGQDVSLRILDLISPIGKGQRSLIVAPPRTGKTVLLQKLALAINEFHPEIHLIVLLVDERPEEVTDMRRTIGGEVVASSNDEAPSKHVKLVEIVLERARRLVESRKDVVILLDSLTRVARAFNSARKGTGRTLSGGLDARTMEKPREFFGAARKVEEGGSLTIIATALIDTGSRMDDVIFEEFKGTGNMELVLHRGLADRRIWPALDIRTSGTRKEEKLRSEADQTKINMLRRALADQSPEDALPLLLSKVEKTKDNAQFLSLMRV